MLVFVEHLVLKSQLFDAPDHLVNVRGDGRFLSPDHQTHDRLLLPLPDRRWNKSLHTRMIFSGLSFIAFPFPPPDRRWGNFLRLGMMSGGPLWRPRLPSCHERKIASEVLLLLALRWSPIVVVPRSRGPKEGVAGAGSDVYSFFNRRVPHHVLFLFPLISQSPEIYQEQTAIYRCPCYARRLACGSMPHLH